MINKNNFLLNYKKLEIIGNGGYGKVYKIKRKKDNKLYALKILDFYGFKKLDKLRSINEADILSKLDSPYIIKLIEYFHDTSNLYIILEYQEGGDMLQMIKLMKKKKVFYPEGKLLNYFYQLCIGINYIHQNKIIHRDIKLSNIFLNKDKSKIKIADFNISKIIELTYGKTLVGTAYYISPELLKRQIYDYSIDIWSLGCLIYELCNYRPPFYGENEDKLKKAILNDNIKEWNPIYSQNLFDIIKLLLDKNPKKRPIIGELLNNPIFDKIKIEEKRSIQRNSSNFKISTSRNNIYKKTQEKNIKNNPKTKLKFYDNISTKPEKPRIKSKTPIKMDKSIVKPKTPKKLEKFHKKPKTPKKLEKSFKKPKNFKPKNNNKNLNNRPKSKISNNNKSKNKSKLRKNQVRPYTNYKNKPKPTQIYNNINNFNKINKRPVTNYKKKPSINLHKPKRPNSNLKTPIKNNIYKDTPKPIQNPRNIKIINDRNLIKKVKFLQKLKDLNKKKFKSQKKFIIKKKEKERPFTAIKNHRLNIRKNLYRILK